MNPLSRNHVQVRGQGRKAMIFVHGYGCDQSMWRFVAPAFEHDYRVILLDLVGCGHSDATAYERERYSTLQGYADDLIEVCRALDVKQAIFVGHSVSAMIGVLAAIQEPNYFERLVMIGPSPSYINDGDYVGGFDRAAIEGLLEQANQDYLGWARAMGPAIMGNSDRPALGDELTNSFCRTQPEIAKHFARVVFLSDNRADLPKLRVPSLILQCSQDIVAPESVGRYLHRHLAGSEFKQLRATGHCPHVSEPQETIDAIREYLGRQH